MPGTVVTLEEYNGSWYWFIDGARTIRAVGPQGEQGVQGPQGEVIPVTSILLSGDRLVRVLPRVYTLTVGSGENVILTAAAYPANALVQTLLWYSFDSGIASIRRPPPVRSMVWTAPGMDEIRIDAHAIGTAEIAVTAQGTAGIPVMATITVTVLCCASPVQGEWAVATSPTAAAPGVAERRCVNCGNVKQTIPIPYAAALTGQTWLGVDRPIGDITVLYIPYGVTVIAANAFRNRPYLEIVFIPNSVTSVGWRAFANNQLTSVTIPDSVTSIGNMAFANNQLTSVIIPDSITSIALAAFNSNQLVSVIIPDSVIYIGGSAFAYNQLTSVTIPDSVNFIRDGAFMNNQLISITILGDVAIEAIESIAMVPATMGTHHAAFIRDATTGDTSPFTSAAGEWVFADGSWTNQQ